MDVVQVEVSEKASKITYEIVLKFDVMPGEETILINYLELR